MNKLSIVIPAYNEEKYIESSVSTIIQEAKAGNIEDFEVIIIENGSSDNTLNICRSLQKAYPREFRLISLPESNYGKALKAGIKNASGMNIAIFNIDFWDIKFLKESLQLLKNNDFIVGSKVLSGSRDNRPFTRKFITMLLNILIKVTFRYKGTDTHGIKVISSQKVNLFIDKCVLEKELFDTELMIRAQRAGLSIVELPVEVAEIRPTRYGFFKRACCTLRDLVRLYINLNIKNR
ncbi:MAG: glycosyltransferase [Candidatus Omnitrophota bacterium]|jgi:glycosyltransferase involved in cell wall biosynthesis|nr:MAG: glycosyltransferase [Candidatus Omnitrophota bacterium]